MKSKFISKVIKYDGSQLTSHFAYLNFGLCGDTIVSFIGPCRVKEKLVDLEDSLNHKFIYSPQMLHFLVEHFELDLEKAILRQRLLMSLIQQKLNAHLKKFIFRREGDDLFAGRQKLSVSIATLSPVSALIHVGLNIGTAGTPVLTCGLSDYNVKAKEFARAVMQSYLVEMAGIKFSRCKVVGVD